MTFFFVSGLGWEFPEVLWGMLPKDRVPHKRGEIKAAALEVLVLTPREAKRVELVKQWTAWLGKEMDNFLDFLRMAEFLGGPYCRTAIPPRVVASGAPAKGKRKLTETSRQPLVLSK